MFSWFIYSWVAHMVIYLLIWLFARKCIFHIYFPKVWALCRYYIWSKQIATFQSSDSTQNRPPPGERWYRLIKTRLERAHKFGIPSGGFLAARWINVANCNCRGNFASALLVLSAPPAPNCFNKANNKDLELHLDFLMILKAFIQFIRGVGTIPALFYYPVCLGWCRVETSDSICPGLW